MHLLSRFRSSAYAPVAQRPVNNPGVVQPSIDDVGRWTVERTREAIHEHEEGAFGLSALLLDAFGRDDRIRGCMRTLVDSVTARNGDFTIEPSEVAGSDVLAKRVNEWWFDFLPDSALSAMVQRMDGMGVAVARIHWSRGAKEWRPVGIDPWHGSHVQWDENVRAYIAYTKLGDQQIIAPDDPNWLILTPGGDRSWMVGTVRALGEAFAIRRFNWRDWARYNERHGLPLITVKEPPAASPGNKEVFYQAFRKMGSTGIIRLPQIGGGEGWAVDILETKDQAWETFQMLRKDLDISIAVILLGNELNTEANGGSYALGKEQNRVRRDRRLGITEELATALRRQVIQRYFAFNVPGFRPELAPWPCWDNSEPVDSAQEAKTASTAAEAVSKLQNSIMGPFVDFGALAERFNIPLRKGGKEDLEKAQVDPPEDPPQDPPAGAQDGAQEHGEATPTDAEAKPPAPDAAHRHGSVRRALDRSSLRLASGAPVAAASGFVEGQLFVDDVVDATAEAAGHALASGLVRRLLKVIDAGASYEEIRKAVHAEYAASSTPTVLSGIVQKALILAELAGATAVDQDQPPEE